MEICKVLFQNALRTVLQARLTMCYSLAAVSNKSTTRPPLPPLGCGGEWKERGRNWWVRIRAV